MEDDDEAEIRVEAPEAALDLVARDDLVCLVDDGWEVHRTQLDLDRTATVTAKFVHTDADKDPMQPRVPAIGIAEPRYVAPGQDQRFLDRISSAIGIAEDQASGRVETPRGDLDQRLEGAVVALPCLLDEISLHVAAHPVAARLAAVTEYGGRLAQTVRRKICFVAPRSSRLAPAR